jgi:hypothetical protein
MIRRPSENLHPTVPRPPDSPRRDAISRLLFMALLLFLAYMVGTLGQSILKTGNYDYQLDTGDVSGGSAGRNVRVEEVHATGGWAREQGLGFETAAVTLVFWSFIVLWSMAGPLALGARWTPLHSLLTFISLGCCCVAIYWFFSPWRIGRSMSATAFYIVLAVFLYLATLGNKDLVKARSQKIFPALIASAVILGVFLSGYAVGIIIGIFVCILLSAHVLMLIPRMRAELWTPGEKGSPSSAT